MEKIKKELIELVTEDSSCYKKEHLDLLIDEKFKLIETKAKKDLIEEIRLEFNSFKVAGDLKQSKSTALLVHLIKIFKSKDKKLSQ